MSDTSQYSMISIEIPDVESRIREYEDLGKRSGKLHSSYLFYRENIRKSEVAKLSQEVCANLTKVIGGTRPNLSAPGWKNFGYHLGLSSEDINYIDHSIKACPTETVLRVFAQDDESTIQQIIESLLAMERLDVIEGIFDALNNLLNVLERNDNDQGYYSNNENNLIIKPNCSLDKLPEALQWNKNEKEKNNRDKDDDASLKVNKPSILLTYFDDGIDVANKVSDAIQNQKVIDRNISVICLEKKKFEVLTNPEQYIRYFLDEVDYVVPIITKGYIKAISSPTNICSSATNNVDCMYVRFIYTLMSSHYINGFGCLNKKIRSILPLPTDNMEILSNLYNFPHLQVWMSDNEIEKFITSFFRNKRDLMSHTR